MNFDAVLIAGPTASGKSAAALALAEALNGVVINADSMQVYAEAPILTAQPDADARARVPHLLYGHVPAATAYSTGRYAADAAEALKQTGGRLPIFVGGTGLYFTALTEGLSDIPPVPSDIRARARALLEEVGVRELHAQLALKDPKTAAGLRPSDPQRVVRAWEVLMATGTPLADWQQASAAPVLAGMRLAKFVIDLPRPVLRERIGARFESMMGEGGLKEAEGLAGLDPSLPAAKLLGLRELIALGRGEIGREEAVSHAVTATRQFAKRQMTWFRNRMADYVRFDPSTGNIITMLKDISV